MISLNLFAQRSKSRKAVFIALAVLVLASLIAIAFHHHEAHDRHAEDCSVCLFAHTVAYLFVFFAGLASAALLLKIFFARFSSSVNSRSVSSALHDRAPPVLA